MSFQKTQTEKTPNENEPVTGVTARYYMPWYIFSGYPRELSKLTTLMRIFTPLVWFLVFLSTFAIVAFFNFGAYVGKKYGLRTANEEITLYPLR